MSFSPIDSSPFLEKPNSPLPNNNPALIETRFHKVIQSYRHISHRLHEHIETFKDELANTTFRPRTLYILCLISTSLFWLLVFWILPSNSVSTSPFHSLWAAPLDTTVAAADLVPHSTYTSCGSTPAEALSLSCKYDVGLNFWIPSACYDAFSISEYKSDETWYAWRYENQTSPLSEGEMGLQKYYWTAKKDHVVHCTMLWKRQFRALTDGRRALDNTVVEQEHVSHCSGFLMKSNKEQEEELAMQAIRVDVGFGGCYQLKEL